MTILDLEFFLDLSVIELIQIKLNESYPILDQNYFV